MSTMRDLSIDAIAVVRIAFLAAAALIVVLYSIPLFRSRLFDYGPRSAKPPVRSSNGVSKSKPSSTKSLSSQALDSIASILVPHSWFASFYVVSTLSSLFWVSEIYRKGSVFALIASSIPDDAPQMKFTQIQLIWLLMLAQGSRRLYESTVLTKESRSTMWVGHWAIGLAFYVGVGLAVWIEGAGQSLQHKQSGRPPVRYTDKVTGTLAAHEFTLSDLVVHGPSLRTFVSILLFLFSSGLQHDCHAYLALIKSAPKSASKSSQESSTPTDGYILPAHPAWSLSLTPHYLAECLIYLSFTILAAPEGRPINLTLGCALVFVVINLGVTADGTREWYRRKFGGEAVKGRARMITRIW